MTNTHIDIDIHGYLYLKYWENQQVHKMLCVQGILAGYTPITFTWGKTNKRRKGY